MLPLLLLGIVMTLTSCSVIKTTFSVIKTTYKTIKGSVKGTVGIFVDEERHPDQVDYCPNE